MDDDTVHPTQDDQTWGRVSAVVLYFVPMYEVLHTKHAQCCFLLGGDWSPDLCVPCMYCTYMLGAPQTMPKYFVQYVFVQRRQRSRKDSALALVKVLCGVR